MSNITLTVIAISILTVIIAILVVLWTTINQSIESNKWDQVAEGACIRPSGHTANVGDPEYEEVLDKVGSDESSAKEVSDGPMGAVYWLKKQPRELRQCILNVDFLDKDNRILYIGTVKGGQTKHISPPDSIKGIKRVIIWCSGATDSHICNYGWRAVK